MQEAEDAAKMDYETWQRYLKLPKKQKYAEWYHQYYIEKTALAEEYKILLEFYGE